MSVFIAAKPIPIKVFFIALIQISAAILIGVHNTMTQPAGASFRSGFENEAQYNAISISELQKQIILPFVNSRDDWGWLTTTIVQNPNVGAASLSFHYYNSIGQEVITISDTLPAMTSRSYPAPLNFSGSLVIDSTESIGAIVNETPTDITREGDGLMSYKGIPFGYTDFALLPVYREYSGWNSLFVVQNAGSALAPIDITFINAAGDIVHTLSDNLPGHASHWYDTSKITSLGTGFFGSAYAHSERDIVGVTHAENETTGETVANNSIYVDVPLVTGIIDEANGVTGKDTSSNNIINSPDAIALNYLPHLTKDSTIYIHNAFDSDGAFSISFYNESGSVVATYSNNSLGGRVTQTIVLNTIEQLDSEFVGSAIIASTFPLVSAVESHWADYPLTRTAYSGISASLIERSAFLPQVGNTSEGLLTGISVQNAEVATIEVAVKYYDEKGNLVADETALIPAAASHYFDQAKSPLPPEFMGSAQVTSEGHLAAVGMISAHDSNKPDDWTLAEKYAPILYRASAEVFNPVSVNYTLRNSWLISGGDQIESPSIEDLVSHKEDGSFLDLAGTKPSESQLSWMSGEDRGPAVYARVEHDNDTTIIQYWFHYYYNSWGYTKGCDLPGLCPQGNNHEGDWEMIQVVLQNDKPTYAVYSQHNDASKRLWEHVEKEAGHPVVYVAWGSHASYFKDAFYYQLGLWSETTGRKKIPTSDMSMLLSSSIPPWLVFRGRWGADTGLGGSGRGPRWENKINERERWSNPLTWWEGVGWDEDLNYGSCKEGIVDPDRRRNWRMCVSGLGSLWLKPILKDRSGNILVDPDTNNIDPSERSAEYLLNCENNGQQNIILYKTETMEAIGSIVFDTATDQCSSAISSSSLITSSPVSITLSLPNLDADEIVLVDFLDVALSNTSVGEIKFDAGTPTLELDHDNDGSVDETLKPDNLLHQQIDYTPPSRVTSLKAIDDTPPLQIEWLAPGNDGNKGVATYYDLRYSTAVITEANWESATPIPLSHAPSVADTIERITIDMIPPGRYFFALRTFDQDYNVSSLSNSVDGTVWFIIHLPAVIR